MKISEIIEDLKKEFDEFGDMEVIVTVKVEKNKYIHFEAPYMGRYDNPDGTHNVVIGVGNKIEEIESKPSE